MNLFLASTGTSKTDKKGYYGSMKFLDNQTEFVKTFGSNPTLLPSMPTHPDNGSAMLLLHNFSEKCKLDIFIHLCMLDYVGNDIVDPSLNVVEVCRQISDVKKTRMVNGKLHTATPDELFDEFSEISVSLPDNATSWTLHLCSSYLSALTSDLSEAVTPEKTFVMPNLSTLTTKALQLTALRTVRSQVSASYRELLKEKVKMTTSLRNLNTTQNRGFKPIYIS